MKKVSVLLTLVFVVLIVFGCSKNETGGDGYTKKVITINDSTNFTDLVTQIVRLKDLLQPLLPDDVTVEWSYLQSGGDIRDAMLSGNIDIATMGSSFVISAIENGIPLRILSGHATGSARLLSTKEHIVSITDLTPNSKITVASKGSYQHISFALRCLDVFNNPMIFDGQLVPVPNSDILGVVQTSQDYDAFVLTFPSYYKIPDTVNYHIIDDLTQMAKKYNVGSYLVTTERFSRENPVIVEAFRKACEQAVDLIMNNTDEMAVLLSEFYGVDAEKTAETIRECPPKLEMSGYDDLAEVMFDMQMLTKPPKKFSELPNYSEIPKR